MVSRLNRLSHATTKRLRHFCHGRSQTKLATRQRLFSVLASISLTRVDRHVEPGPHLNGVLCCGLVWHVAAAGPNLQSWRSSVASSVWRKRCVFIFEGCLPSVYMLAHGKHSPQTRKHSVDTKLKLQVTQISDPGMCKTPSGSRPVRYVFQIVDAAPIDRCILSRLESTTGDCSTTFCRAPWKQESLEVGLIATQLTPACVQSKPCVR